MATLQNTTIPNGGTIGSTSAADAITIDSSGNVTLAGNLSAPNFVGMISAFAMSSAPSGWLICNGAEVLIIDYQDLYDVISTTWNTATDPTTGSAHSAPSAGYFRLPDFRGSFLRGIGTASGKDATSLAGYQGEKTKLPASSFSTDNPGNHTHSLPGVIGNSPGSALTNSGGVAHLYGLSVYSGTGAAGGHTHTINGGGDNETRPINFGVLFCIRY